MVIDVGGTSTDVGQLRSGFPREANSVVEVGGVRTLFRMPDLFRSGSAAAASFRPTPLPVGPESVGYRLIEEALVFGGATVTATDVAVAAGIVEIGDSGRRHAAARLGRAVLDKARCEDRGRDRPDEDRGRRGDADRGRRRRFLVPDRMAGVAR